MKAISLSSWPNRLIAFATLCKRIQHSHTINRRQIRRIAQNSFTPREHTSLITSHDVWRVAHRHAYLITHSKRGGPAHICCYFDTTTSYSAACLIICTRVARVWVSAISTHDNNLNCYVNACAAVRLISTLKFDPHRCSVGTGSRIESAPIKCNGDSHRCGKNQIAEGAHSLTRCACTIKSEGIPAMRTIKC